MCRVLVTGATGAIGPGLVSALRLGGCAVRTFSLESRSASLFPGGVDVCVGDIRDTRAVKSVMADIDSVVHLAALLHIENPPRHLRTEYRQVNVAGTRNVVQAAIATGHVGRIVLFSTIGVYGPTGGRVIDEGVTPNPSSLYARTKLAAEKIVLAATSGEGQPLGTVLRLAAVYGSRIKGNYKRLVRALARGQFIPIGDGTNRRTLVYERDVARAAVLALRHPGAGGKVFNVSDGDYHAVRDIVGAICRALGQHPPRISLPSRPVRFLVGVGEDLGDLVGLELPIAGATIDKYTEDIAVDASRIQTQLGFRPKYDLLSGWRETVDKMRAAGEL